MTLFTSVNTLFIILLFAAEILEVYFMYAF